MKKNLYVAILSFVIISAISGCSSQNDFESDSEYYSEMGKKVEPENPYSNGSGHSAGYEWAERTGGGCNGKSDSFNEGCEEYYSQMDK